MSEEGNVYYKFEDDDIVDDVTQVVTEGVWDTNGLGILTTFFTSSVQSQSSGIYYFDMYKNDPDATSSLLPQFSVTYGHILGSGSRTSDNTPTNAIYGAYRNLLLSNIENKFRFTGETSSSNDIYALNIYRSQVKEKLDPANWELHLYTPSGSEYEIYGPLGQGGLTRKFHLIDDSTSPTSVGISTTRTVYHIVSGTIDGGIYAAAGSTSTTGSTWGYVFPDLGIMILNPKLIDIYGWFNTNTNPNVMGNNPIRLAESVISGSYFAARNEQNVTSTHYFCRVKNKDFNYSFNPSFTTGSLGYLRWDDMYTDPKVYITTVGLYSDTNELLAVAKLSQPQLKSFDREILCKVMLSY